MSKLANCQFIEIKLDGKAVAGSSEESKYKNWMEGYSSPRVGIHSSSDGPYFESNDLYIMMTKESGSLLEKYLSRGYKNITITVVHRGSDQYAPDYEIERLVYDNCNITSLIVNKSNSGEGNADKENNLFMHLSFNFAGDVEMTFNVPNVTETGLDKIGPIKYSIPEKALK